MRKKVVLHWISYSPVSAISCSVIMEYGGSWSLKQEKKNKEYKLIRNKPLISIQSLIKVVNCALVILKTVVHHKPLLRTYY